MDKKPSRSVMEVTLDMTPDEVLVTTLLAMLGSAILAGSHDEAQQIGKMIMDMPDAERLSHTALNKMEATIRLANGILRKEAEGNHDGKTGLGTDRTPIIS